MTRQIPNIQPLKVTQNTVWIIFTSLSVFLNGILNNVQRDPFQFWVECVLLFPFLLGNKFNKGLIVRIGVGITIFIFTIIAIICMVIVVFVFFLLFRMEIQWNFFLLFNFDLKYFSLDAFVAILKKFYHITCSTFCDFLNASK